MLLTKIEGKWNYSLGHSKQVHRKESKSGEGALKRKKTHSINSASALGIELFQLKKESKSVNQRRRTF